MYDETTGPLFSLAAFVGRILKFFWLGKDFVETCWNWFKICSGVGHSWDICQAGFYCILACIMPPLYNDPSHLPMDFLKSLYIIPPCIMPLFHTRDFLFERGAIYSLKYDTLKIGAKPRIS